MSKFYALAIVALLGIMACEQPDHVRLLLTDRLLLYVEDIDGRDGLSAGEFSDIVVHDLASGQTHNLTTDGNHYASPTLISKRYSDPNKPTSDSIGADSLEALVLFAGKVGPEVSQNGLSVTTRLYTLNPENGTILPWQPRLSDVDSLAWYDAVDTPIACQSGQKVAFARRGTNYMYPSIYVYDAGRRVARKLEIPNLGANVSWSEDCGLFALNAGASDRDSKILIVDSESLEVVREHRAADSTSMAVNPSFWGSRIVYVEEKRIAKFSFEQSIRELYPNDGSDALLAVMPTTDDYYVDVVRGSGSSLYYIFMHDGHYNAGRAELRRLDLQNNEHVSVGLNNYSKADLRIHLGL